MISENLGKMSLTAYLVNSPFEVGHLLVFGVDTKRPLTLGECNIGGSVPKAEK